jgi:serine/threonine-protein kinase
MTPRTCTKCGEPLGPGARFCIECGTAAEPDLRPVSERLQEDLGPDYEVLGELGQGGFAVVFLVRDCAQSRYLAVKVMRKELLYSKSMVHRFRREISYASKLQHPNIVPVAFSVERLDLVYYAMPRIRGFPLHKRIEQLGALQINTTIDILRQLAAALAYAHEHDVIHRDVKPSNVIVGQDGMVQILDFGVAKGLTQEGGNLTASGELIGSPEYMSPEQAAGSADLDHRTDIYSWGIVGFELLTGKPPFRGTTVTEILYKHMTDRPPDLKQLRTDAPAKLASVINTCLEKETENRWAGMRDAMRALPSP